VGQRNYVTATCARELPSAESKSHLIKLNNGKFTGLYKSIAMANTLIIAYKNIKSKPGNMTPGLDEETLDGISMEYFQSLAESLQTGKFQFKPARKVHIPKPKGGTRPLAIASPRDKIVQEAMRMTLESIFEPCFSDLSFGFSRHATNRGCHSALKSISTWNGIT